jgi:hypothetical protein
MRRAGGLLLALLTLTACGVFPRQGTSEGRTQREQSAAERVEDAIAADESCQASIPFYWEIGDVEGVLASGHVGAAPEREDSMAIASATKWLFGAYVIETADDLAGAGPYLNMTAGYNSLEYRSCRRVVTVEDCWYTGDNSQFTAADVGVFHYASGHFQKWAMDHGMGAMDNAALAAEFSDVLGVAVDFNTPQMAAGAVMSAAAYAQFLQRIVAGELAILQYLGRDAVCTLPQACTSAEYSPAPAAWHYAWGHWIEDDAEGDGVYSSPGAFGFYPWVTQDRLQYGLIARAELGVGEHISSAMCGRAIRAAWRGGEP